MNSLQTNPESALMLQSLASSMKMELVDNIIPFWLAQKDSRGGFFSYTDAANNRVPDADKGALLNSRILWFFSRTARTFKGQTIGDDCRSAAQHAFDFLKDQLLDKEYGGLYWSVDAHGDALDVQKHVYNQAFAIYALAEWVELTGDQQAMQIIDELYGLVERHARDHDHRGYLESFDRFWASIPNELVCDTEDVVSDKSMNTHLHIMEAYSRLYDIRPSEDLKAALIELVQLMCNETQNDRFSFAQFFTRDWQIQSVNHSFGHDIEGSWLIWEAAQKVLDGEELNAVQKTTLAMVDSVYEMGVDFDGAVCNEWLENKFVDTTRVWWVQAEAIVGFVNAWEITQNKQYLSAAMKPWEVVINMLSDKVHGEWHWETDRWGNANSDEPKVSFWKCPYHNGRACLEVIDRAGSVT